MLSPPELLDTAERLAIGRDVELPLQSDLRRAISTAHYALFHTLSKMAADLFIGPDDTLNRAAWLHVYRSLDHATAKRACRNDTLRRDLSVSIRNFAEMFAEMQSKRQQADYDPAGLFVRYSVLTDIFRCREVVVSFQAAPEPERRAFCTFVLFKLRTLG